jgi:hypothetical protein
VNRCFVRAWVGSDRDAPRPRMMSAVPFFHVDLLIFFSALCARSLHRASCLKCCIFGARFSFPKRLELPASWLKNHRFGKRVLYWI